MTLPELDFALLREANATRQKEWDRGDVITLEYRSNELAGEVGEACNIVKKLARERLGIRGSRATVRELADELADVVICVDLVAMHAGIDLGLAVGRKFNATSEKNGLSVFLRRSESTDYVEHALSEPRAAPSAAVETREGEE
jgi:NTP pyrophosphatase (non-canonical NTP hydrolase)